MTPQARIIACLVALVVSFCGGLRTMAVIRDEREHTAQLEALKQQEVQRQNWANEVAAARSEKDEELRTVNARLADALVRLRKRPERLPEPARQACEGATGRELAAGDAEFLSRYAARAAEQEAALSECYAWIDAVKH